jgi:hypothetical protein
VFYADSLDERIHSQVLKAAESLKPGEQLMLIHHQPGSGGPITVSNVGYKNPMLIILHGRDSRC